MTVPWLTLDWNTAKRWRNAEYETPSPYTSGKDTITVSIEVNRGDKNPWTEYQYWIYCYQDR